MSTSCTVPVPAAIAIKPRRALSLARSGSMALSLRTAGAGGLMLSHIVLARSLGVAGFGEYAQAITWLQFLCIFGKLGLDNSTLRFVSEYVTKNEPHNLRGFISDSTRASFVASLLLLIGFVVTVWMFSASIGTTQSSCLIVAAPMIPLLASRQLQEASLRGIGLIFESQIGSVVWPFTLFALTLLVTQLSPASMSSPLATLLHFVSLALASALVLKLFRRSLSTNDGETPQHAARQQWINSALAFLMAELLISLKSRVSVAMAGIILGRDSAGLYAAMERFADASVLGSQSLGLVIAPQFAALFAASRFGEMKRLMWQGQILSLAFTLPVAIGVACCGEYLILLLGPDFRAGWSALMALLASACITSFAGPAAYVLQMSGHERTLLVITAICAVANIVLSLLLMNQFGVLGLGLAQMIASLIWTVGVRISLVWHPAWQRDANNSLLLNQNVEKELR